VNIGKALTAQDNFPGARRARALKLGCSQPRHTHTYLQPAEDHTLYASHTVWESRAAFEAWTKSEAFRAAHCPNADVATTAANVTSKRKFRRRTFTRSSLFLFRQHFSQNATPFACARERGAASAGLELKAHPHMLRHACGYARHPLHAGIVSDSRAKSERRQMCTKPLPTGLSPSFWVRIHPHDFTKSFHADAAHCWNGGPVGGRRQSISDRGRRQ
jgi:hypothetical protein